MRNMPPRRVTLKVVAAAAGVSYQTVSKMVNHQVQVSKETDRRIWHAIESLNYRPSHKAHTLRSQRNFTLGYFGSPTPKNQTNPILDQFLHSMFQTVEVQGYSCCVSPDIQIVPYNL